MDAEGARAGTGTIEGAVFALLGLLIAFTFSGAAARFEDRRALIIEETNDIGTAYLRLDLLPASAQPACCRPARNRRCGICSGATSIPAWRCIESFPIWRQPGQN